MTFFDALNNLSTQAALAAAALTDEDPNMLITFVITNLKYLYP
jgi:hypothetical protein